MATDPSTPPVPTAFAATAFFSKTYDEARDLLIDARDYLRVMEPVRWGRLAVSLAHSLETTRLTTRLTHIMAWLMVQRAVDAGEITLQEAREEAHRLGGQSVCLDVGAENSLTLPGQLRALLQRSRMLYQRVARLEEMLLRDPG
ncbi:MAG: DUF1465 family protein [Proteobacteria bacterium]|nr:DUF1465 family protein [Pseudomonadota bacterium]